ncbi:MAG: glycosyltransferase [Clostridiales bacterium]|nr:glycosyltransferase [Clostridiales bacterium]
MEEKVSVIIPAYNAEKYLKECLDSVLAQTHKNVEIVAVNDGSKDGTGKILDEYAEKYDNVTVLHTENRGVSCARNTGLDTASGQYVMFLDSDDYLPLNAIEILYNDLTSKEADVACALLNSHIETTVACQEDCTLWEGAEGLIKALEDNPYTYSSCAKLYKSNLLSDIRFIEGRKIHEDSYFVFRCFFKQPRITVRNEYLYCYRVNENSASHAAFSEKYFDILYFAEEKRKAVEQEFPQLTDKANNMLVKANLAMLQCFLNTKDKRYKQDIKKCIRAVKENGRYFVPTYPGDKQRFLIARYNLYWLYKKLYRLKYGKRISGGK